MDKAAGVVVHPAPGHAGGTLAQALAEAGAKGGEEDRPGIVHRLDRDTSGLLVVARSDEAYDRLQELVRRRELTREYLALVWGSRSRGRGLSTRRSAAIATTGSATRSTRIRRARP